MGTVLDTPASPLQIMSSHLAQIANEIALDILPVEDIKKLYGLDDAAWDAMLKHPTFDAMLTDAIKEWNGASNVEKRIRLKAKASIEMSLLRFHTDMNNPDITLASRTEALKTIMKLAGMDQAAPVQVGGTGGWSLQIHIGNQVVGVTPSGPASPIIEGEAA